MVEMLRLGQAEVARRWLAALMLVPASERAGVVAAVERQIVTTWASREPAADAPTHEPDAEREVRVVSPPRQRAGYVEQVETTYVMREAKPAKSKARKKRAG